MRPRRAHALGAQRVVQGQGNGLHVGQATTGAQQRVHRRGGGSGKQLVEVGDKRPRIVRPQCQQRMVVDHGLVIRAAVDVLRGVLPVHEAESALGNQTLQGGVGGEAVGQVAVGVHQGAVKAEARVVVDVHRQQAGSQLSSV